MPRPRSTRDKIRWSMMKIIDRLQLDIGSLELIDILQRERSEILTDQMPNLVILFTETRKICIDIRENI